ncbi:MAG: S-ribosylhomocysteine lyase [Treponema sp.]|jgi:S-ribosylhomocysteine lyase|nr:S-ribosylhomocysteine lyase [Treponema sp.]
MDLIASFQIDHTRLLPGIYVSRKDVFGPAVITTFDLRFKMPNREPVMDMPVMHTFEHLAATYIRSDGEWGSRTIYFGPMGCRTGFYAIFEGDRSPQDILPLMRRTLDWIIAFEGDVPGAAPAECGNWREHNLDMTKYESKLWAAVLQNAKPENLTYPVKN